MNIRLTPRQLNVLKTLAGEAGLRPGELVTSWVEERLEAERVGAGPKAQSALAARIDELAERIAALEAGKPAAVADAEAAPEVVAPKRRGRPPKSTAAASGEAPAERPKRGRPRKAAAADGGKRVPLHQEIMAVIGERGPQTAAELAAAITERGVFRAPRSGKPLDAATVNSRVSNPVYRSLFRREGHRVALADG
ncbi:MAG TPA: hypothetical protein VFQ81_09355 [Candidatus Limnocylindria bacterium]|nr:hypothetical protein [Candidatus Limnocylindria bacterium]